VVRTEDFAWLADLYAGADDDSRSAVFSLFQWTFDFRVDDHRNFVLDMARDHPLYVDQVHTWIDPVELDSPDAKQMRRSWEMVHGPKSAQDDGNDDVNEQIERLLDRYDNDEADGFWHATRLLTVAPGSKVYGAEFDPDLASMPRWSTLSAGLRDRIFDAAEHYLRSQPCRPEQWLHKPEIRYHPAVAGYRAMVLLLRLSPGRLRQLPGTVWVEWAPILASWTTALANGATWDDKFQLLELAGSEGRDAARSSLLTHVTAAVSKGVQPSADNEAGYLWDDDVAAVYLSLAHTAEAEPRAELVATLAKHDFEQLRPLLLEWLDDTSESERHRLAVKQLFDADLERSWPLLRAAFESDIAIALQVLGDSVTFHGRDRFEHVPAAVIADLYLWLRLKFPPGSDPTFDDAHVVGPREQVGNLRDNLLIRLRDQGTPESVKAVRSIATEIPDDRWLARTLATAESALRRNQWSPTPMWQLLRLAADRRTVLINDSAALAAAVANALADIQTRLTGATPESHYLWDTHAGRPKSEDEVSDYLRNELTRVLTASGVIVNREVQVRRNRPSGIGERTDLLVDAAPVGETNTGRLSVPVEVKGAWNGELLTAMSDQLVDRYMSDTAATDGIYVVAWPDLQSWTAISDDRRAMVASLCVSLQ